MEDGERDHQPGKGNLTLCLPSSSVAPPPNNTSGGAATREDCWTEGATNTLIDSWGHRYLNLNRGNLKQKQWREVADAVNSRSDCAHKTDVQCKNRLDTLKKKYKVEKAKVLSGAATSWTFYAKLDGLIGPSRNKHHQLPQPLSQLLPLQALHPSAPKVEERGFDPGTSGSRDTTESCPNVPATSGGGGAKKRNRADLESPLRELAGAISKFGEVYERMETAKQQQMMELERQRMEFSRDLEVQRLQLFMQTQIELAKLEHAKNGST
ncbi:hypothetical protein KI387_037120, partial [Taxus chinensis]